MLGWSKRISRLEHELTLLRQQTREALRLAQAAETRAAQTAKALSALEQTVNTVLLPDDSAARQAKEQIDAFNRGIFNILTYQGRQGGEAL